MTIFLRLLADKDKAKNLSSICAAVREAKSDARVFQVMPESFRAIPGAPFAYWVSDAVRTLFERVPRYEQGADRTAKVGLQTSDDERFVRGWWEVACSKSVDRWFPFAKGESIGAFYGDVALVVGYSEADQLGLMDIGRYGRGADCYFRPGITWALRAARFAPRALPAGCIFSNRGQSCFAKQDELLALMALLSSSSVDFIYKLSLGRFGYPEFLVGILLSLPVPRLEAQSGEALEGLGRRAWALKRTLDTVEETSHAFELPAALRARLGDYEPSDIEEELARIQDQIDAIAFNLYGFSDADRAAVQTSQLVANESDSETDIDDQGDDEVGVAPVHQTPGLLSWAIGVAFGRFDWRLVTGERAARAPEPFDPLPAKSPGMLPDGAAPFHAHAGLLVDDQGHSHDLARLVEEVLAAMNVPVPHNVRRWLQRDFFPFHLQRYSKSGRKAPIYWPLSTSSGSYTLWVYYPSLTSQTLYTAINDFVEPKLEHVSAEVAVLRNKGPARTRDDEKQFEAVQALELELIELRDTLLNLAPKYKPNHDDGVQVSAAPLWSLFQHKPWQKVLKDTWTKLGKRDYDWAHMAMNYWPEPVREKCKFDKSLAIAHGLAHLYVEPEGRPTKMRGRKRTEGDE